MGNDEARMTNAEGMAKPERLSSFEHSSLFRHSSFGFRHFPVLNWVDNPLMKLTEVAAPDFDLAMTLDSGQVFHWERIGDGFCGAIGDRPVYVAHIRQISHALRRRFGEQRKIDKYELYSFPSAERIAGRSEKDLRECALGYRAKNLLATAGLVSSGEANLEAWAELSDVDLRAKLCALPGVGAKVANCVMLFAYERLRAFPIDVWIERVLREKYFPRARKLTERRLRAFSETYFGEHGGYAQQYLFHHARHTNRPECKRGRNLSAPRR